MPRTHLVREGMQAVLVDVVAGDDVGGRKERAFEGYGSRRNHPSYLLA